MNRPTTLVEPAADPAPAAAQPAAPGAPAPTAGQAVPAKPERRRTEVDRRSGGERRKSGSAFDRNRGPGRRRTDYRRDAEEGHMNEEQLEFIRAIDEYKRVNDRPFPTLTEILDLLLYLGYRKVAPVGEFKLCKGRQNPPRNDPERGGDPEPATT